VLVLDSLEPHPVRAVAERFADLGVLELGENAVDAVHVEAEQVVDPVVGVGAAARRGSHLPSHGQTAAAGASIVIARVETPSASWSSSSPGRREEASSVVAPQVRIGRRSNG
jgi:hypothetical protein